MLKYAKKGVRQQIYFFNLLIMKKTQLMKDLEFTENQQSLVNEANTNNTAESNGAAVMASIYLINTLQAVKKDIINSNEKLAKSNDKYNLIMCFLTGGLVFAGIVQIITTFYNA